MLNFIKRILTSCKYLELCYAPYPANTKQTFKWIGLFWRFCSIIFGFWRIFIVVIETGNDHKHPKQPRTSTNDHKSPAHIHKLPANNHKPRPNDHKSPINNHKRPNRPLPNSNYLFIYFFGNEAEFDTCK